MKILRFIRSEILRVLSNLEFRYYKNNSNSFFRNKYIKALGIQFQSPISIGIDFYLRNTGNIKVGKNCSFGSYTKIWNYCQIEIGNDFLSAGLLTINTGTHDPLTLKPIAKQIIIGNRVWTGLNVTILAGVTIGNDVVIAAGSIVNHDIPSNAIIGGIPAKIIKEIDRSSLNKLWGAWGEIELINKSK